MTLKIDNIVRIGSCEASKPISTLAKQRLILVPSPDLVISSFYPRESSPRDWWEAQHIDDFLLE